MPLFSSIFEGIIFVSLILLWILVETISFGILPGLRRSGMTAKSQNNDKYSNLLLRVTLYVSIVIAILLSVNNIFMLPAWFFYPGAILMATGILVRQWSIFTLGRYFTLTINVQKNQKVVDYGPYRFIRHPSYLGMSITVIGIGIALQSLGGILAIIVLYGLAVGYRIRVEEKFLVSELGEDYVQYMKRTKRLIPFIY